MLSVLTRGLIEEAVRAFPSPDGHVELTGEAVKVLNRKANRTLMALLSRSDREELDRLGREGGDALGYLRSRVTDLDAIVVDVVVQFWNDVEDWKALTSDSEERS